MSFNAVLFDLDGTLLDTLDDLAESMNEVLAAEGFPLHSAVSYKRFVGDGVVNLVRRALPDGRRDDATISRCTREMRRVYGGRWDRKTRPYAGVAELLDGLVDAGLRLAVLSNKPHEMTRRIVDAMLARWRFDAVEGAKPEVPQKPDPAPALAIADRLAVAPQAFLYLGDTDTDMRTATAAGMYAVGALWGFRGSDELLDSGARALVETPAELLDIVGRP